MESALNCIHSSGNDALSSGRATKRLMHIISSAYFSVLFKIAVYDITKETADSYAES